MKNILYCLALVAALITQNIYGAEKASSSPAQSVVKPRIDIPVTEENSVLYDLGYGGILRIPKLITGIPEDELKNIKQPIELSSFQFSFLYPDMMLSGYPGEAQTAIEIFDRVHKLKPDRFPVFVQSLFYSPEELGNVTMDEQLEVPMFRPMSLFRNAKIYNAIATPGFKTKPHFSDIVPIEPTITDSKYRGLREVHFPSSPHNEKRIIDLSKQYGLAPEQVRGHLYIGKENNPYELYLRCEAPGFVKCEAFVFIKSNRFQYKLDFPPEAVAHTDELIQVMNKMIDSWVVQPNTTKVKDSGAKT